MPIPTALTADATAVYDACAKSAEQIHGTANGRQRFVPLRVLRIAVDIPPWRFDRAAQELASTYHGWLRVDWQSDADDDRASIRRNGTDYHQISVDPWNVR